MGVAGRNTAANDQGKQVGAADAEDAPDGRADQPLQADRAQLPFEQHDGCAHDRAHASILEFGQPKRFNKIRRNCNYNDKKKTYKNQIHSMTSPGCSSAKHLARCTGAISSPPRGGNRQIKHAGRARIRGMNVRPVPARGGVAGKTSVNLRQEYIPEGE